MYLYIFYLPYESDGDFDVFQSDSHCRDGVLGHTVEAKGKLDTGIVSSCMMQGLCIAVGCLSFSAARDPSSRNYPQTQAQLG